jgi:hypothetical protein
VLSCDYCLRQHGIDDHFPNKDFFLDIDDLCNDMGDNANGNGSFAALYLLPKIML